VLQKGVQVKIEVYKTKHKGWAVRAAQAISRGTFICEYLGEVLNDQEANKRGGWIFQEVYSPNCEGSMPFRFKGLAFQHMQW
jgi:hypothetical protein